MKLVSPFFSALCSQRSSARLLRGAAGSCLVVASLFLADAGLFPPPLSPVALANSAAPQDLEALVKQIDELWDKQRQENSGITQMRSLLDQALKSHGERYEVTWRMARHQWWLADAEADSSRMEALSKKGWEWGEKAIKANPTGVEGQFWTSVNIGQYSLSIGILRALANGIEGKFNAPLDKSLGMDKAYADCGPLRTKGNYFSSLPWPKQDLEKAEALLQESLKICPEGIRSRLYLAEVFKKKGDTGAALRECDKIINTPLAQADGGDYRRVVERARTLKKEIAE